MQRSETVLKIRLKAISGSVSYVTLVLATAIILYPLLWTFMMSLRTNQEIFATPWGIPTNPVWENYMIAWEQGNLGISLENSVVITFGSIVIMALICPMAAYALSKPIFGRKFLFYIFLVGMFMAPQVFIIPLSMLLNQLGLIDTLLGLIIVDGVGGIPYCIIIIRAAFLGLPACLEDSAKVDGLSTFQTFRKVLLPIVMPAVYTALIIEGIWVWNDFFYPLILTRSRGMFTLPLGIAIFRGGYMIQYGPLSAGTFIAMIPVIILYIVFADLIRRGVAGAIAVKGAART